MADLVVSRGLIRRWPPSPRESGNRGRRQLSSVQEADAAGFQTLEDGTRRGIGRCHGTEMDLEIGISRCKCLGTDMLEPSHVQAGQSPGNHDLEGVPHASRSDSGHGTGDEGNSRAGYEFPPVCRMLERTDFCHDRLERPLVRIST